MKEEYPFTRYALDEWIAELTDPERVGTPSPDYDTLGDPKFGAIQAPIQYLTWWLQIENYDPRAGLDERIVPLLLDLLIDGRFDDSSAAGIALTAATVPDHALGGDEYFDTLISFLLECPLQNAWGQNRSSFTSGRLVKYFGKRGDEQAVEVLLKVVEAVPPYPASAIGLHPRGSAVECLRKIGSQRAYDGLVTILPFLLDRSAYHDPYVVSQIEKELAKFPPAIISVAESKAPGADTEYDDETIDEIVDSSTAKKREVNLGDLLWYLGTLALFIWAIN